MNNSDIINSYEEEDEVIETSSELSESLINPKSITPGNNNDDLPTTSTPIEEALQSPNAMNTSLENINIPSSLDINQLSIPSSANSSFDSTNQQIQLNAQIQQNQQQILKYKNQLQQMQMRNTQIEKFYNNIQSPPEHKPYKTVTWYPKWISHSSPFEEKIIFHVELSSKNETTLISTLKKRRNEAKANPNDYGKIVQFCNHLFNSMKYIEDEQSDILNDALKLLKKSVKENCLEACNILAMLYLFGIEGDINHKPDYEKAGQLFMKVLKNTQLINQHHKKQQLSPETTYNLGLCYEKMESNKKRKQAISFFKFAAINDHPGAAFKMYKIYENVSPKEAIKWLKSSLPNVTKEFPESLYEYALLCYKGYESGGITKSESTTISYLKEAADKFDHVPSALELGKFYLLTEGNKSTNAGKYLHMAACKGNKIAQYKLASWWDKQPVKVEMKRKAYYEWLARSAEGKEGLPEAIYKVGYCYEMGYGVTKDENVARSYYENAAARGLDKAKEKLEKMKKSEEENF